MHLYLNLSTDPIAAAWGDSKISYSPQEDAMHATIHLDTIDDYLTIQKAARSLAGSKYQTIYLAGNLWSLKHCFAFSKGIYKPYKAKDVKYPELEQEEMHKFNELLKHHLFLRNIINESSQTITPTTLVAHAQHIIDQAVASRNLQSSVSYKIVTGEELINNYPGTYTVGKGSVQPACYLKVDFNPLGKADAPVTLALVGKGITFDTGGYSLKPSEGMMTMRADMGGAALMVASFAHAIASGLAKRVVLHIACAENMISGNATVLGNIIEYTNGVRVENNNTDAEGRLVLADCLIEAEKDQPQYIIDAATLTGAAKAAVGSDYHSLLSQDDSLVAKILEVAAQNQELFWRLPFADIHRDFIKTPFADISNTGATFQAPGASTATAFLSYFLKNYKTGWLHIDASATFNRRGGDSKWAPGATGIGLETLSQLIVSL